MTDKNSSSHHHQHHHHCCPKQLQRQQGRNQQQPAQQTESATTTAQTSCNETTTTTGKKNDHHQTAIKSVSSKQCPSPSSLHPHQSDLDNNTLTTTAATENPNGAQMRNVLSSSAAMVVGHNQQHVITNNRNSSATSTSSIVAANQHLNNLLNTPTNLISVTVAPFTGGPFTLTVNKRDSVEELKKAVAKKLKVLKDRICLLYRESQLSEGSLDENSVVDGSRITLLPRAETGLLAQKPEQSVMQALESLNDSQVVDFLSGKAPLNLTMRLGDHMMLIQLQLSTVNASSGNKRSRTSSTASAKPPHSSMSSTTTTSSIPPNLPPCCSNKPPVSSPNTHSSSPSSRSHVSSDASSAAMSVNPPFVTSRDPSISGVNSNNSKMSTPKTSSNNVQSTSSGKASASSSSGRPLISPTPAQGSLNGNMKTGYKPKLDTRALAEASKNLTQTLKQLSSEVLTTKSEEERPRKRARTNGSNLNGGSGERSSNGNKASKADNERQGSSTSSGNSSTKAGGKGAGGGGAIIESMHHHGKGVYSGTFSGTLNPALQDRNGQPKRDITTIIHILNDLLCAQYKNYSPGTTTETQTTTPNTNPTSASHTTSANPSSKTSTRSSESHKTDNITKPTKSGINPSCSCSNDVLVGANPSLNQKSTLKAANETRSGLPTKRGNNIDAQRTGVKDIGVLQDQVKVTKDKMEHLKRIMEERKAKRRARREARAAPYSTSWSLKSSDTTDSEDREETINRGSDNTVEMQVDTASSSSSNASTKSGGSTNPNGQNSSTSQTGTGGGNPSDIFNPELEPVTA